MSNGNLKLAILLGISGTQEVRSGLRATSTEMKALGGAATALKATMATALAGLSVAKAIGAADDWGQYASRIKNATKSVDEYNHAQSRMLTSAQHTFRAIGETRESFIRLSPTLRDMGLTLDQSIDAIDAFSGLLVVNAASAERGATAQDALSKALQKGSIDAKGWATIASTMPTIVTEIAAATGKTEAEIRKLGASGKLALDDLVKTLTERSDEIGEQVAKMPTTVADAMTNLASAAGEFIGQMNQSTGATTLLVDAIGLISNNFDTVAAAAGVVAAVVGGKLVSATVMSAYQFTRGAIEGARYEMTLARMAVASGTTATGLSRLAVTGRAVTAALTPFGGLLGAAVTVATIAAVTFSDFGKSVQDSGSKLIEIGDSIDVVREKLEQATEAQRKFAKNTLEQEYTAALEKQTEAWENLENAVARAAKSTTGVFGSGSTREHYEWRTMLQNARGDADALVRELEKLEAAGVIPAGSKQQILDLARGFDSTSQAANTLAEYLGIATSAVEDLGATADESGNKLVAWGEKVSSEIANMQRSMALMGNTSKELEVLYDIAAGKYGELNEEERAGLINTAKAVDARKQYIDSIKQTSKSHTDEAANIRAKTATLSAELELLRTRGLEAAKMTESQKKVLEIESKLTEQLTAKQRAALEGQLVEHQHNAVLEGRIASEREALELAQQTIDKAKQSSLALQEQIKYYGLTERAINELRLAEAQAKLDAAIADPDKTQAYIESLRRARDELAKNVDLAQKLTFKQNVITLQQATKELLDQSDLLAFEATLIGKTNSERQKEIALYKIRKQLAEDIARIEREIADGEEQRVLIAQAVNNANIATVNVMRQAHINAADEAAQAWQKTVDQVNQSLIDALMDGFESGKSFAKNFRDTLVNMFKTLILRPIISPIVTGGVGGLANMFGLGGMGGAGGGLGFGNMPFGGAGGLLGGAGGALGLFGSYAGAGSAALWSGSLGYGINSIGALFGAGNIAGGLGMAAGMFGPIIGGIALIANLLGAFDKSDPHVGATGWYETGKDPWNQQYQGDKYNEEIGAVVQDLAGAMGMLLQDFFTGFGLGDKDIRFGAGWVDDFDNSGPSFGDVKLYIDGEKFIDWQDLVGGSKEFSPGEGGYEEFVRTMLADVIDALASIEDLPSWAQDTLAGFDTANATVEQLAMLLASIQQMSDVFQTWRESITGFADYTNEAISALMEAAGGFESLAAAVSSYYANYYSEAEQVAMVQRQLSEALAEYGLELPRSKEDWRALVEEALAAGEEGADLAAALLGLSEAFAQAEDAAKQMLESVGISASSMSDIIRDGLIGRMSREDVGAALGDMVIGGMYNALYGGFADQITSIFVGGIVTPVIQAAMAGELLSTAISQESIRAVTQAALAAADALAQIVASPEWQAIMDGVNIAIGGITQVMRPATAATNSYTSSVNSAASATNSYTNAVKQFNDTLLDEVQRLRGGLIGGDMKVSEAYYAAQFATLTAQARAGDDEAAKALPDIIRALEEVTRANASSEVDVRLMQAKYLASLEETRRIMAASFGITLTQFDVGTNFVPVDMIAQIHAGERIIPAADNIELMRLMRKGAGAGNYDELIDEIRAMREDLAAIGEKQIEQQRQLIYLQERTESNTRALDSVTKTPARSTV